jgi:hypothetical protein
MEKEKEKEKRYKLRHMKGSLSEEEYKKLLRDPLVTQILKDRWLTWVPGAILLLVWPIIEPYVSDFLDALGSTLRAHVGQITFVAITVGALFVIGTVLYAWRCRYLGAYGFTEIAVGLCTGVVIANSFNDVPRSDAPPNRLVTLFAILAALYVIVRGYDSMYKSLKSERAITFWNRRFFKKDSAVRL